MTTASSGEKTRNKTPIDTVPLLITVVVAVAVVAFINIGLAWPFVSVRTMYLLGEVHIGGQCMDKLAGGDTHLTIQSLPLCCCWRSSCWITGGWSVRCGLESTHLGPLAMASLRRHQYIFMFPGGIACMGCVEASRLVRVVVVESKEVDGELPLICSMRSRGVGGFVSEPPLFTPVGIRSGIMDTLDSSRCALQRGK